MGYFDSDDDDDDYFAFEFAGDDDNDDDDHWNDDDDDDGDIWGDDDDEDDDEDRDPEDDGDDDYAYDYDLYDLGDDYFPGDFHPAFAIATSEPLALKLFKQQEEGLNADDGAHRFFSYENLLEYLLIVHYLDSDEKISRADESFDDAYHDYAYALRLASRYDESILWSQRVLRWSPFNFDAHYNIAECYRLMGNAAKFEEWTNLAYKYAISRSDIANWLRLKAYLAIQEGNYHLAGAELVVSDLTLETERTTYELESLRAQGLIDVDSYYNGEVLGILDDHKVPYNISKENGELLYDILMKAAKIGEFDTVASCANNLEFYTDDNEFPGSETDIAWRDSFLEKYYD